MDDDVQKDYLMIREAVLSDLDGILSLEQNCFGEPWSEQNLRFTLENTQFHRVYLLEDNLTLKSNPEGQEKTPGEPFVYVIYQTIPPEAELLRVGCSPLFRRKGSANALLQKSFHELRKQGIFRITLEVREGNQPALALYHKLGFTPCGRIENYYQKDGESALILEKSLTQP